MALLWSPKKWSAPIRYGLALALVTTAAGCNYLLPGVYGDSHYYFFSVAVLASALIGGVGPGLLATCLAGLASAYFFIYPFCSIRVESPEAGQRLAMFVVEGAITTVGHVIRSNRTPELVSTSARYGSAVALVAGASVLKLLFLPDVERHVPFTFFYSAIVATAWIGGAAPGLLATALSAVSLRYLLLAPSAPVALGHPELVLFALEATVLCLLTGTFRERLRETEAHLGRIFEDAPVGILILDGGTRIRKVNPAFRQFLGRLPTADNEIADVVHADSQPQVRAFLHRLTHERATANVEEIGFLNGPNLVWANLRGSRIQKDSGRAPICMVMAEDITERRRTEQALRETEARLHRGDRMEGSRSAGGRASARFQ